VHRVVQCLSGLFIRLPGPVLRTCSINVGPLWPWPRINRELGDAYLDARVSNRCRNILNHKPTCNICCVRSGRLVTVLVEWSISLDLYSLGAFKRQDDSGPMILLILNDQIEDSTTSDPRSRTFVSSSPRYNFIPRASCPNGIFPYHRRGSSGFLFRHQIVSRTLLPNTYLLTKIRHRLQPDTLTRTRLYLPVHVARGERELKNKMLLYVNDGCGKQTNSVNPTTFVDQVPFIIRTKGIHSSAMVSIRKRRWTTRIAFPTTPRNLSTLRLLLFKPLKDRPLWSN